jgi:hypothetical protein
MWKRLAIAVVLAAGCQADDPMATDPAADRGVPGSADPDDQAILDAALKDLLTNPDLADSRAFYGSGGARVLYDPDMFPPGYVPAVPGFQFEARAQGAEVPHEAPRQLTVQLRWFRGRPMYPPADDQLGSNQALRDRHKGWPGVALCMFNGGGSGGGPIPIGGCHVYYDVRAEGGRWVVTYKGAEDP